LSVVALALGMEEEAAKLSRESLETYPNSGRQASMVTISSRNG